ncbi:ABC transporter ATP-binding protein [Caenimonas aquaedulcis]|uniref:ABC transporter ATP-binding protein n=1 Tax=Caenimonas aquaedulcis TaxID=2793270 RepID=A0A931H0T7_9BURK|nr:ABC transporter ATP-binding protein [Caenimonas aquaedulcis]
MSNTNAYLTLSQVDMVFGNGPSANPVLSGIDLAIQRGEFISLIGHSGCGKSTVLNIVAGLLRATSGGVILDNREVNAPGPDRAVVFQNHSLLPWLTVYQNVEIAVDKIFRETKTAAERKEWILRNLEMVSMSHALNRLPSEISGGMKQRVGIARALAMEPKVLLLDEPFGALDALTRAHLQDEVIRIQSELGNTVMMITHDVDEAVLLSDRVVMMTNGPSATIGQILPIDLPRPRNRIQLAEDRTYNHCRQEILTFLYEKQRKVEPIAAARARPAAAEVALRA